MSSSGAEVNRAGGYQGSPRGAPRKRSRFRNGRGNGPRGRSLQAPDPRRTLIRPVSDVLTGSVLLAFWLRPPSAAILPASHDLLAFRPQSPSPVLPGSFLAVPPRSPSSPPPSTPP